MTKNRVVYKANFTVRLGGNLLCPCPKKDTPFQVAVFPYSHNVTSAHKCQTVRIFLRKVNIKSYTLYISTLLFVQRETRDLLQGRMAHMNVILLSHTHANQTTTERRQQDCINTAALTFCRPQVKCRGESKGWTGRGQREGERNERADLPQRHSRRTQSEWMLLSGMIERISWQFVFWFLFDPGLHKNKGMSVHTRDVHE